MVKTMETNTLLWRVFICTLAFLLARYFNTGWWMLCGLLAFVDRTENKNTMI